jgi:predicted metalloprotease with PDZ domain
LTHVRSLFLSLFTLVLTCSAAAQNFVSERLHVDLSDAPRNVLHATVNLPVTPGPLTIVYPKWIPGNHRPTGPIQNLMGLHMKAGGQELEWRRDLTDMYAFHVQAPQGVSELEISFDTVTYNGTRSAASSKVVDLNWNQVIVYPQGKGTDEVQVTASIRLPQGWKFGTALVPSQQAEGAADFQPVSLTRLVDSPLIAGAIYRQIQLSPAGQSPVHVMDMVAESEAALQITDKDLASYKQLIGETGKLFGARHYEKYHFLVTLSDQTAHHGLEHHESSDNGTSEDVFSNPGSHNLEADLLPHEFVHSWNGKYRRPEGLATPDYQVPMKGDLLWVYEGLTDYLGDILAARVGLRSPEEFRENAAYTGAMLGHRAGRTWRPLQDTATSVQTLFTAPPEWTNWRRSADYYPEGFLIWLDADTLIRRRTNGQKSLNDFCRLFFGGQSGPPKVVSYTFEDVVSALNQVLPYDWAAFMRQRLDSKSPEAPLGGFDNGGWKLIYNDQKNATMEAREKASEGLDLSFSLGMIISKDGTLADVIPGSPSYEAGAGPGMKLIGVNGRKYSKDWMRSVLKSAMNTQQPISLLLENAEYYVTYQVNYHGGERYPHLVRNSAQPDVLTEVIKPLASGL